MDRPPRRHPAARVRVPNRFPIGPLPRGPPLPIGPLPIGPFPIGPTIYPHPPKTVRGPLPVSVDVGRSWDLSEVSTGVSC